MMSSVRIVIVSVHTNDALVVERDTRQDESLVVSNGRAGSTPV